MTTVATAIPRRSLPGTAAVRARGRAILATGRPIRTTTSSRPRAPAASVTLVAARRAGAIPGAGTASTGPLAGAGGLSVRGPRSAPVGAGACIARTGRPVTPRGSVLALRPAGAVTPRRGTVAASRRPAIASAVPIASAVALRPTRPAGCGPGGAAGRPARRGPRGLAGTAGRRAPATAGVVIGEGPDAVAELTGAGSARGRTTATLV